MDIEVRTTITFSEISNNADFEDLRQPWNALLKQVPDENPYLSFEWVHNYWKHLGRGRLSVWVGKRNGEVCCIAPLQIEKKWTAGLPKRVALFASTEHTRTGKTNPLNLLFGIDNRLGWSDQADFIYDPNQPEDLRQMLQHLKKVRQWDVLDLREIPPDSPTLRILEEEFNDSSYRTGYPVPMVSKDVLMPDGFEAFKKTLNRKTKKNINLYSNRLAKLGGVQMFHYQDEKKMVEIFPQLVALEEKGQKGAMQSGAFSHINNRSFHEDFFREYARFGRLHLFTLEREQQILSFIIYVQGRDCIYAQDTGYHPDYQSCSPGFNIIIESLKTLSSKGFKSVNLGRGNTLIIHILGNHKESRTWIKVFKKGFASRISYFFEFVLRPKLKSMLGLPEYPNKNKD